MGIQSGGWEAACVYELHANYLPFVHQTLTPNAARRVELHLTAGLASPYLLGKKLPRDVNLTNKRACVICIWLKLRTVQFVSRSPWCFLFALLQNKRSVSLYTFLFFIHLFHVSLAFVSFVWPGVVSGFFQTSAEMPFEAYIVMSPYPYRYPKNCADTSPN